MVGFSGTMSDAMADEYQNALEYCLDIAGERLGKYMDPKYQDIECAIGMMTMALFRYARDNHLDVKDHRELCITSMLMVESIMPIVELYVEQVKAIVEKRDN